MRALIIKDADLQALRCQLLDRSVMRPIIQHALESEEVGTIDDFDVNAATDAVMVAVEQQLLLQVSGWVSEVSK